MRLLVGFVVLGALALSTKAFAETNAVDRALIQSGRASGEVVRAVGDSGSASVAIGSGIVAVPVWVSGQAVRGSGEVLTAVGGVSREAGKAAVDDAGKLWDFSTGPVAERPPLAREKAVPARKAAARLADPSPAQAMAMASVKP